MKNLDLQKSIFKVISHVDIVTVHDAIRAIDKLNVDTTYVFISIDGNEPNDYNVIRDCERYFKHIVNAVTINKNNEVIIYAECEEKISDGSKK